jgi:hypothetical protein
MKISKCFLAAVAGIVLLPALASAASHYVPSSDYAEFFSVSDRSDSKVVMAGNPFPDRDAAAVARDLLPAVQAARSQLALTAAADVAPMMDQPDYRVVLVFSPAWDLAAKEVCGRRARVQEGSAGQVGVYAVYCRNNVALAEATVRTPADGPRDPRMTTLLRKVFTQIERR